MTFLFIIPGALRQFTGGQGEVRVHGQGATVGEALALLWREFPAVRDRIMTERGDVRPHLNIFVDGENVRYSDGLNAALHEGAEIVILPAVSGGNTGLAIQSFHLGEQGDHGDRAYTDLKKILRDIAASVVKALKG